MNIIQQLEAEQAAKIEAQRKLPEFSPGDTVRVNVRVTEGTRTRVQAYEGVCIARSGGGINESFTVRKILTTNPPPMSHKAPPRINKSWTRGEMVHLPPPPALPHVPELHDEDNTPRDGNRAPLERRETVPRRKLAHHNRLRPPPHDKGKS